MSDVFRTLLSGLASGLGLETLAEQNGKALIVMDDFEVSLVLLPSEQVLIHTVVAPLPEEGRAALMADLLNANTMFLVTQGFTLSAREDTGVMLQGVMPLSALHSANVSQWVENFVNVAEFWQGRCLQAKEAEVFSERETVEDPLAMLGMLRV